VGVFEKLLRENNLDHESSRLSIQWLNSAPGIQPATDFSQSETTTRIDHFVEHLVCTHLNTKNEQSELPATSEMRLGAATTPGSYEPWRMEGGLGNHPAAQTLAPGKNSEERRHFGSQSGEANRAEAMHFGRSQDRPTLPQLSTTQGGVRQCLRKGARHEGGSTETQLIWRLTSGRSYGRRAREKNQTRHEQLGSSIGAETRRRPLREDPKRKH
jgi:hypothetical protein